MCRRWGICFAALVLFCASHYSIADVAVYDPSFNNGGPLRITRDGSFEYAERIANLPDGRFAVSGNSGLLGGENGALLALLRPDGTLDSSAAGGGVIVSNLLSGGEPLAIDAGGRILLGGATPQGSVGVARFLSNGIPDTTFGSGGVASFALSSYGNDTPLALGLQANGRIIAAGYRPGLSSITDAFVSRFTAEGVLDLSFNTTGYHQEDFNAPGAYMNNDWAYAVMIQPDGKIIVGGMVQNSMPPDYRQGGFSLVRYNSDGSHDQTFGQAGVVITPFPVRADAENAVVRDMKLLPGGRILAAGVSSDFGLVLAMYKSDGSLDPSFGQDGKVIGPNLSGVVPQLFVEPDGSIRVVVVGDYIQDLLYAPDGSVLRSDTLALPPFAGLDWVQYIGATVLEDGDILAVGQGAPQKQYLAPENWFYTTDAIIARFDRPQVPEPMACLLFVGAALVALRVRRR